MNGMEINNKSIATRHYRVYDVPAGVRKSYASATRKFVTPSGTGRPIRYGDRIFVRLVSVREGWRTLADFSISEVNDLSEIFGELRHYTRGEKGLTRLYIRNATRGWSFEQPFMLYADRHPVPASSVTRTPRQPAGRHEIPESVRLLYDC